LKWDTGVLQRIPGRNSWATLLGIPGGNNWAMTLGVPRRNNAVKKSKWVPVSSLQGFPRENMML
jgi:hypothetical protein